MGIGPCERSDAAEGIRRRLADAWGSMGTAWGVAPAIARVHAYLLARDEPLTEREVREALDLTHRAASMALAESVAWGLVERLPEPRRVGRRGPAGAAYRAVGDHWRWFGLIITERKRREADPVITVLEGASAEAVEAAARYPDDAELSQLRDWLAGFVEFVERFDRAISLVPLVEPTALEHGLALLARLPDDTVVRLVELLGSVPDDDVVSLLEALARLSPSTARRATRLMARAVNTMGA